jgi:hypothetical protein
MRGDSWSPSNSANPYPTDALAIKDSGSSRQAGGKMQDGWLPEHLEGVPAAVKVK